MPSEPTRHTRHRRGVGRQRPGRRAGPSVPGRAGEAATGRAGAVVGHDPAGAEHRRAGPPARRRRAVEREDRAPGVELERRRSCPSPASRQAATMPAAMRRRPCGADAAAFGTYWSGSPALSRSGPAVGRDVALVAVGPDVHDCPAGRVPAAAASLRSGPRRSAPRWPRCRRRRAGSRRRTRSGGRRSSTTPPIGRPSRASARTTHSVGSIDAARAAASSAGTSGVALVGVVLAVARGVGEGRSSRRRASRREPGVGAADRLGDPLGGELEDARVESVAAQRRVAGVVERPDRAGGRVGVRGRDQQPLGRDTGVLDPLDDLLGERVRAGRRGRPAPSRTCAPPCSSTSAPRAHARVDALAGLEASSRRGCVSGSPTICSGLSRSCGGSATFERAV